MTMPTNLRRGASAIALGLALTALLPGAAMAQDAGAAPVDEAPAEGEIVVSGIRGAINNSVQAKKANTSIVEVVSSEDIGKLPDLSIAESLSRLPGLATQRLDGRANVVSIRGLAPDFTTTLLNGREQVSASNNRGVELDQYPSELLNGAIVYKTPDASLIGQAIGGTIDMRTVRPLAHGKRTIAASSIPTFRTRDIAPTSPISTRMPTARSAGRSAMRACSRRPPRNGSTRGAIPLRPTARTLPSSSAAPSLT